MKIIDETFCFAKISPHEFSSSKWFNLNQNSVFLHNIVYVSKINWTAVAYLPSKHINIVGLFVIAEVW